MSEPQYFKVETYQREVVPDPPAGESPEPTPEPAPEPAPEPSATVTPLPSQTLPPLDPPVTGKETPDMSWTLERYHRWLLLNRHRGAKDRIYCLACAKLVAEYKRKIAKKMVQQLDEAYRRFGFRGFHWQHELRHQGGDAAKFVHWGLIEEIPESELEAMNVYMRDDGGRQGYWRVLPDGAEFLAGRLSVPRQIRVYTRQFLGFVDKDDQVFVHDCYEGFRLDTLREESAAGGPLWEVEGDEDEDESNAG